MDSTPSATSAYERKWKWCICTRMALTEAKCAECGKPLGNLRDVPMEYAGQHWHLSCLLDTLTQGPRLIDNPYSPLGGAGFHP